MQAHELFRYFRMPELVDLRQYVRTLPTNTLMGFGAFAALTTFWYATRPKALKPPCDLSMQSVEVALVSFGQDGDPYDPLAKMTFTAVTGKPSGWSGAQTMVVAA